MLKLFGSLLIISAFGFWGISKSQKLKKRSENLLTLISSLTLLENEISYSEKDIASALRSVGIMENLPLFVDISENLKNLPVQEAFSEALKNGNMCLSEADREILFEFSKNLGTLSKEFQISSLLYTKELLSATQRLAYQDYGKYGKLYRNMGFLLGILIAILLF